MTPLDESKKIGNSLNINLFYKRDDLFALSGGGNKARKLAYILKSTRAKGCKAIVTTGSNQSNHIRAAALFAVRLGWKLICIIHDTQPKRYEGNLKLVELCGAELRFVQKTDVKAEMDKAMIELRKAGYKPFYIWGGGHCVEGAFAYYEAVSELKGQLHGIIPHYIFVASGTGTTQAGIEVGVRRFLPQCKVIGISIARKAARGKEAILQSMKELNTYLGNPISLPDDIVFDDAWIGGGYEAIYPELSDTIRWAAQTDGIILDPTYTGKAFHALKAYVRNGKIEPGSIVVFWHTGGLLNLMATKHI